LASQLTATAGIPDPTLETVFRAFEKFANNLTNVDGFGLYYLAGILILPSVCNQLLVVRALGLGIGTLAASAKAGRLKWRKLGWWGRASNGVTFSLLFSTAGGA
jgi:hypothetical protein